MNEISTDYSAADEPKKRKSIQSVEVGVRVLEAMIDGKKPMQLRDIAKHSDMSRSQCHRYLLSFVKTNIVEQDSASGAYLLGPMALRIGMAALSRLDFLKVVSAKLSTLVDATGYTGLLSIWGEYGPTVVRWIEGEIPVITSLMVGSVLPLTTSSTGVVFLAHQHPSRSRPLLSVALKRPGARRKSDLKDALIQAREKGYATTEGQVIPGLSALNVPVFNVEGWPIATMGLIAYSQDENLFSEKVLGLMREGAREASSALGFDSDEGPAALSIPVSQILAL